MYKLNANHIFNPMYVAKRQAAIIESILTIASPSIPLCKSSTVSRLKLENVVKPPQNPVTSNIRHNGFKCIFTKIRPIKNPAKKLPNTLQTKMLQGNNRSKFINSKN